MALQETRMQERTGRQETRQENSREESREQARSLRLTHSGELAGALLAGESLFDLPPGRLEELASLIGNRAMEELLESQSPPLEEARFELPRGEPETVPYPAEPEAPALAEPGELAAEPVTAAAFDPAGLQTGLYLEV